jgi:outer membrane murein-binding lipoprotein Lpp
METISTENNSKLDIETLKAKIEQLLASYRAKHDELEWADDEWESSEIQEELDRYAKEIKKLKAQVRELEQA